LLYLDDAIICFIVYRTVVGVEVREDGNNITMKYTDNGQRRSMRIKKPIPGMLIVDVHRV